MVIIIKTAQQSNKSHHSLPEIAIDSMLTREQQSHTIVCSTYTSCSIDFWENTSGLIFLHKEDDLALPYDAF